ncbi:hypothetical protein [Nocardioides sp. T2.26MG-1]|uniref:hypothetical protein n=1 Tax=Nocardioides sp. T2.26MG-1 TaxID=3041166 RepID=UPI0025409736|nr:hypothetical protein [Nocardioides sp. T2.26MG-1]
MPRVQTSALAALCLATSVVLAGCGADGDGRDAASRTPSPTASPSASRTATAAPSASEPTTSAGPTREPRGHKVGRLAPRMRLTTAAHLLDAESLPPLGDGSWEVAATGPEDPERDGTVGTCQKTLLGPIGAVETVRRTFTAPGRLAATQVVARFADSRSAWRAHQVLVAWRDDCADRVDGSDVGPLRPLDVRSGTGESYRTDARKRAAGLAILRTGSFLTLVEVAAGAEHYPTGWDPARVAARRVARTF